MSHKVLVIIDIQNDITKHYRDIIGRLNAAIDWAVEQEMDVVYIKHNNLSPAPGPSSQTQKARSLCRRSRSSRIIFSLRRRPTR